MIFRFTPVLMLFFLTALVSVSAFLLMYSYRNTQDALEFEQLDHLNSTHELAQQALNFQLQASRQSLSNLAMLTDTSDEEAIQDILNSTLFDFIIRFDRKKGQAPVIAASYGLQHYASKKVLIRNYHWFLEKETNGNLILSYQVQPRVQSATLENEQRIYKAGILLNGNYALINHMRSKSRAFAHYIIYEQMQVVKSVSLEKGVEETAQKVLKSFSPVFSSVHSNFSGDIGPLRIEKGTQGLFLLTVSKTQGTEVWYSTFKESIIWGVAFIILISSFVTFLLRFFVKKSLGGLLEYAQTVRQRPEEAQYQPGNIIEFNTVGRVIETMVRDLSEKAKYISDIVDAANSPVLAWDGEGKITKINKSALDLFGFERRDEVETVYEMLEKFPDEGASKAVEAAMKGNATPYLETQTVINGNKRYVLWNITPLTGAQGEFIGVICQGQDITERRVAERSLRLSSTVFDNTSEGVMITDTNAVIMDVNTAFTEITGYAREEVIGQNPRIMKSGRQSDEFYQKMWSQLNKRGRWRGEIWDKRKGGEEFPKWLSINACRNERGLLTHYVAVFSDITNKKQDQEKLEQLAHYDHLTGLPNRALFQDRLKTSLARCRRDKAHMALLFVDLDRFKQVNDSLGHRVGDLLLKEVSSRLLHSVREIDTVARLSGDEFTVILSGIVTTEVIETIASRIVKSLGAPYFFESHELFVSASVGIAVYPTDGKNSGDLLRNADLAMYHAKEKGRNNYQFFNTQMNEHAQTQLAFANQLRIAMNRNLIYPHYQVKVDIAKGLPVGLEALARWNDERGVPISPVKFIPVAEAHGLITRVGSSILHQVCTQVRMWQDMSLDFGRVAVNLSAHQFRDPNLFAEIREAIEEHRIHPESLEVEVTENMMMDDVEGAIKILENLKEMGLTVAIDDFGTGYSSLNYLKRFPVDTLKIDRTFIRDLTPESDDAAIVSAIVTLSQKLNINVVAEGVENTDQVDFLREIGCHVVQGFLFAKPCDGAQVPLTWNEIIDSFTK